MYRVFIEFNIKPMEWLSLPHEEKLSIIAFIRYWDKAKKEEERKNKVKMKKK